MRKTSFNEAKHEKKLFESFSRKMMSYLYSALEIDAEFLNTTGQISTSSDAANTLFSTEEQWEDK